MTLVAVVLASAAAFCNALAVRLQHGAVRSVGAVAARRLTPLISVACQPRWWLGLVAVGSGAALHIVALGMAPLAVVQPVGVLTLALVVALEATIVRAWPSRTVVGAVALTGVAVAVFVVLASGGTPARSVSPSDEALAAELAACAVLVLGTVGLAVRGRLRCVALSAAGGAAYGTVSALIRATLQHLGSTGVDLATAGSVTGVALALVVGAWSVNQAYASGPGGVVVAALTVVDPFVAVGIGVGLYDEAAGIGSLTAAAQAACAAVAVIGVAALARHLPEPRQKAIRTPAAPRELVGAGVRDHHGSSS